MGDLKTKLHGLDQLNAPDLWERGTSIDPVGPDPDTAETPRGRRFTAAIVAIAVFVLAGVLTWRAFEPPAINASGATAEGSATVDGVTVTAPTSWTLVDLWPLARSIATWPEPAGSSIKVPADTPANGGLPLLQLSNQDLGLRSACGMAVDGSQAVLYVAVNGGPWSVDSNGSPIWSHELSPGNGPCGDGWYAYRDIIPCCVCCAFFSYA